LGDQIKTERQQGGPPRERWRFRDPRFIIQGTDEALDEEVAGSEHIPMIQLEPTSDNLIAPK
jgi:hypothetical protein